MAPRGDGGAPGHRIPPRLCDKVLPTAPTSPTAQLSAPTLGTTTSKSAQGLRHGRSCRLHSSRNCRAIFVSTINIFHVTFMFHIMLKLTYFLITVVQRKRINFARQPQTPKRSENSSFTDLL